MNGVLFRHLLRRYGGLSAACLLLPVLVGSVLGIFWPDWKQQAQLATVGIKLAKTFLRSDLLPADSAVFFFQMPFVHPLTMFSLILAMAIPTIALPAGARGRGSLDLLLATPLTRRGLIATTFAATLPFAVLGGFAPLIGTWIGAKTSGVAGELPFRAFAYVSIEAIGLTLFFAGASLFFSARAESAGAAIGRLAILVFWSLLAEIVGTAWEEAAVLKQFTPYGWYEPAQVLAGTVPWARDAAVLGGAGLVLFAAALFVAERRKSV